SFQDFEKELENIESQYSRPEGILYIAYDEKGKAMGCFGIRKWAESICELKRMYINKAYRKQGFGSTFMSKSLEVAKELGYEKMRLDTLPTMHSAIQLYEKYGFYEIEPYRFNPIGGTKYFENNLSLHSL
ncbi:MAG: GNAT family N-acetyltransferase, partial [Bacteroidota bacterium]